MARKYLSKISNLFKSSKSCVMSTSKFFKHQFISIMDDIKNLRYKLGSLAESNLDLGVYHLRCRNYNDAIFRFKLVDRFLDPSNKLANYWLGWTYFMKQDYKKSIISLTKAEDCDEVELLSFVKSIDSISSIPPKIQAIHRDIISSVIVDKYITEEENLIIELVSEFNDKAKNLPEKYNILDLGANIGMLGDEIHRRMQESYTLTGVEISDKMIELQSKCFPNSKPYDKMIHSQIEEFLEKKVGLYNVIYSLDGFSSNSDIKNTFASVFSALDTKGYFAFVAQTGKQNRLSAKLLEFSYNSQYLKDSLKEVGFEILSARDFSLGIKNNYSIFVCIK